MYVKRILATEIGGALPIIVRGMYRIICAFGYAVKYSISEDEDFILKFGELMKSGGQIFDRRLLPFLIPHFAS